MVSKLKKVLALTFTIFLCCVSAAACTCSYNDIKARGFSGQIFSIAYNKPLPDFDVPLPKATLQLLKRIDGEDWVVAQTTADESGRFSLEQVKAGEYFLKAQFPNFSSLWVRVKIRRSSNRKKDKIVIALAPGLTCCEGYAKVHKNPV